ncbi:MAG TPA: transcriptional regulator [bacterium]|nr:transcriptional regulator [bacterium]
MPEHSELVDVFTRIDDPVMMEQFFQEIFTESERQTLALRWKLMKLLDQGVTQRRIASDLRISLCKITRGAKIMKDKQSVSYRLIHK